MSNVLKNIFCSHWAISVSFVGGSFTDAVADFVSLEERLRVEETFIQSHESSIRLPIKLQTSAKKWLDLPNEN
ncbi:hypothetical protein ACHAWO_004179 [Cyclotella atomus]|uniref:Uncharacterized protein n=1 Tax=Cyclotella atomus TaxID=382360 RepID=A0ABD3NVA4_9STRA